MCSDCLRLTIYECIASLSIPGFTGGAPYTVFIRNHFGQMYAQDVTAESSGLMIIDLNASVYPKGLFSRHSGIFTLTIRNAADDDVLITINDRDYECIQFDMEMCHPQRETFSI